MYIGVLNRKVTAGWDEDTQGLDRNPGCELLSEKHSVDNLVQTLYPIGEKTEVLPG